MPLAILHILIKNAMNTLRMNTEMFFLSNEF
jgi:hypothetical protein